jgi:hypothetical protein
MLKVGGSRAGAESPVRSGVCSNQFLAQETALDGEVANDGF